MQHNEADGTDCGIASDSVGLDMRHYLKLTGLGFAICAVIGLLFTQIGFVPWEQQKADLMGGWFSVSGAYVAGFAAVVGDILGRKGIWATPRARCLGVPLLGAFTGLLVLGWIAILVPTGMEHFNTPQFQRFLCGGYPQDVNAEVTPLWSQARELMNKADLLAACKMFLENWVEYVSVFAALAMAAIWTHDILKPCRDAA
ncbi:MAG TPA: hypothetical protein V6C81_20690 [Planktothrix sp.]|jgi:hypothetical protein